MSGAHFCAGLGHWHHDRDVGAHLPARAKHPLYVHPQTTAFWCPTSPQGFVGRLVVVGLQQSGATINILGTTDGLVGVNLASKPATIDTRIQALVTPSDNDSGTSLVMFGDRPRFTRMRRQTSRRSPCLQLKPHGYGHFVPACHAPRWAHRLRRDRAPDRDFSGPTPLPSSTRPTSPAERPAGHNGVTFLSGGLPSYLSTNRVQEASFLQVPRECAPRR